MYRRMAHRVLAFGDELASNSSVKSEGGFLKSVEAKFVLLPNGKFQLRLVEEIDPGPFQHSTVKEYNYDVGNVEHPSLLRVQSVLRQHGSVRRDGGNMPFSQYWTDYNGKSRLLSDVVAEVSI